MACRPIIWEGGVLMEKVVSGRRPLSELLRAIDTCPTIEKLFELVKNEHIVIRMKSQNAASNIPFRPLDKDTTPPLERLRAQVREAAIAMYQPDQSMQRLMYQIDTCPTIDQLFKLVKDEHIVIQMKSQNAASNIPFRPLPKDTTPPLEKLREQVREAAAAMFRVREKERLIRAIETCPSIDKLFELVKNEHIVIRMKSQNSASNLPQRRLSGAELTPDTTPLERLRQQVLEAVIYGG